LKRLFYFFIFFIIIFIPDLSGRLRAQSDKEFSNPILAGFYPDPSICRVGADYYLVNSTFSYFPGIPVFHSKDLVNWELIGYVMNRPSQLNLEGQGVSRGIFAPAIRYNNGMFYVTCTLVDIGGNFIVSSKNPVGPWSDPVWLPEVNGIDPSLFFDDNDKSYIIYNSVAQDNKPLYDGHRTIRIREIDINTFKTIGEEKILVNGGTDISKKPVWIEGPHIFKKGNYYYLIAAQGGTGENHSEVVFRSEKVDGLYISYSQNPILTQRNLNPQRNFPITSTGHADFVQTDGGNLPTGQAGWWAVFLGCRPFKPFEKNYYNTGRETFLTPVKWEKDSNGINWPVINAGYEEVQYYYPYPVTPIQKVDDISRSGNFITTDNFDKAELNLNWEFLRTPHTKWYDLNRRKGFIAFRLRSETCSGKSNPDFIGRRQQHMNCSASVGIDFLTKVENEKAGLLIFQNENHFYFLCKSVEDSQPIIQLYKSVVEKNPGNEMELLASKKINNDQNEKELYLKIEAEGNEYSFYYSLINKEWNLLKDKLDGTFLSTKIAGGFVGCMFAMYATSSGKVSENTAYFDWFNYQGNDKVYK
jgi:xylan 1,4-beta-xylosidase